ncbi:hypothetical protein [Halobacillus andaensis]
MQLLSARLKYIPITIELAQTIMKNPLAFYYKYQLPGIEAGRIMD